MFINLAHAAVLPIVQCSDPDACNWTAFVSMFARLIDYLIIIATLMAGCALGIAGFGYLLAHGDPGAISESKKALNKALIGFIWLLGAWLIVHELLKAFGLLQGFSIIPV